MLSIFPRMLWGVSINMISDLWRVLFRKCFPFRGKTLGWLVSGSSSSKATSIYSNYFLWEFDNHKLWSMKSFVQEMFSIFGGRFFRGDLFLEIVNCKQGEVLSIFPRMLWGGWLSKCMVYEKFCSGHALHFSDDLLGWLVCAQFNWTQGEMLSISFEFATEIMLPNFVSTFSLVFPEVLSRRAKCPFFPKNFWFCDLLLNFQIGGSKQCEILPMFQSLFCLLRSLCPEPVSYHRPQRQDDFGTESRGFTTNPKGKDLSRHRLGVSPPTPKVRTLVDID